MALSFRLDRTRRAGRYLEWKVALFSAGAVLGLAGMLLEAAWMTLAAIGVLMAGMLLRFLPVRDGEPGIEGAEELEPDEELDGP